MPTISDISIVIRAVTDPFTRGLARARMLARGFGRKMKTFFGPVGGIFMSMGASILALLNPINIVKAAMRGLALAFAVVSGAVVLFVKKQFDLIDTAAKTSRALKIQVDFLEGMKLAGSQLGVSNDKIIKSLKKFTRTMGEASLNTGAGATVFRVWGKNVEDFTKLKVEDSFEAISQELKKIKDPTKQAAIAFQFFGRNGIEMLNIINAGKGSIQDFMEESKRLKGAFSDVDVNKVEAANDAFDKMKIAAGGIFKEMAFTLSPFIKFFADKVTNAFVSIREHLRGARSDIMNGIVKALRFGAEMVIAFGKVFKILAVGIEMFFSKTGPASISGFQDSILSTIGTVAFFIDKMSKAKGSIGGDFKSIGSILTVSFLSAFKVIIFNFKKLVGDMMGVFIIGARTIGGIIKSIATAKGFKDLEDKLTDVFIRGGIEKRKFEEETHKTAFKGFTETLNKELDILGRDTQDVLDGAITSGITAGFINSKQEREKFVRDFVESVKAGGSDFESSLNGFLEGLENMKWPDNLADGLEDSLSKVSLSPKLALRGSQAAAKIGIADPQRKIADNTKDIAKTSKSTLDVLERMEMRTHAIQPGDINDLPVNVFSPSVMAQATGG